MRQSTRIESLSYGTIYLLGCILAAFLSLSQGTPVVRLITHTAASWVYVVYYVLHFR